MLVICLLAFTSCQTGVYETDVVLDDISTEQYAISTNGMVSPAHPLAIAARPENIT